MCKLNLLNLLFAFGVLTVSAQATEGDLKDGKRGSSSYLACLRQCAINSGIKLDAENLRKIAVATQSYVAAAANTDAGVTVAFILGLHDISYNSESEFYNMLTEYYKELFNAACKK